MFHGLVCHPELATPVFYELVSSIMAVDRDQARYPKQARWYTLVLRRFRRCELGEFSRVLRRVSP